VAFQCALMPARQDLFALALTRRLRCAAQNGRIDLRLAARAEERLIRDPATWFAEAEMAELATLVLATRKRLVAGLETQMPSEGVSNSLLDRAAYLLALVLLATLELPAHLLALELFALEVFLELLHEMQAEVLRVVYLVAGHESLVLPTDTGLLNENFALAAVVVVAALLALVKSTRKELVADSLTDRNPVGALASLLAKQSENLLSAARAVLDSLWCLLARLARSLVAHFGAGMLSTVQLAATDVLTDEAFTAAFERALFLAAEAGHRDID